MSILLFFINFLTCKHVIHSLSTDLSFVDNFYQQLQLRCEYEYFDEFRFNGK